MSCCCSAELSRISIDLSFEEGKVGNDGEEVHLLCNSSCVDQDVDSSVVVHYILHSLVDCVAIANIDAVEACIDASLIAELASCFVPDLLLHVEDSDTS